MKGPFFKLRGMIQVLLSALLADGIGPVGLVLTAGIRTRISLQAFAGVRVGDGCGRVPGFLRANGYVEDILWQLGRCSPGRFLHGLGSPILAFYPLFTLPRLVSLDADCLVQSCGLS